TVVNSKANTGTPRVETLAKILGASPLRAIAYNIRVEAYEPELAEETIDVKITAFIKLAAKAIPAFLKTIVKGDTATFSVDELSKRGS
ncbi:hypothetical protein Q604_UNBC08856G0001, partial [human gut metagenome]